jgi:hypothetical protein
MSEASYNDIAEWYDRYLRENPIYHEVALPNLLKLVGAIKGHITGCSVPISIRSWRPALPSNAW